MSITEKISALRQKIADLFDKPQAHGITNATELMNASNAITREVIKLQAQEKANTNK